MNKKEILVLGCSYTNGDELHDEHLFDNYWDFQNGPKYRPICIDTFQSHLDEIMRIYNNDIVRYYDDCRQWTWAAKLDKNERVNVTNYAMPGTGIDMVQYVYNLGNMLASTDDITWRDEIHARMLYNCYCKDKLNMHTLIYDTDILIWQLTNEPRPTFYVGAGSPICFSDRMFAKNAVNNESLPKWKAKLLLDYYENIYTDINEFKRIETFMKYVVCRRALLGKHTILFSFFPPRPPEGKSYDIIDNEFVHYVNNPNNSGLVSDFSNRGEIDQTIARLKFGHPTKQVQLLIGNEIENYLIKEGLI